jgi:tetratricopeptide (TPR) repeat protein
MESEDLVETLAEAAVFNDFTDNNKVGAIAGGVGALYAIGALGIAGPIAIPLVIVGGVLAGANGESSIKNAIVKGVSKLLGIHSAEDYFQQGLNNLKNSLTQEALQNFTNAINKNPNYLEAYFMRGSIYSDSGEYNNAISDYTSVLLINPKHIDACKQRGHIYAGQKKYDHAILDYTRSIELNSNDADIFYRRGQL